jgi:hypothetical protein
MTTTPKPRRRWFQFTLRTLLVLMLLVCIGMGWLGVKMQQTRKQRAAINAIVHGGGRVTNWGNFTSTFEGWQGPSRRTMALYLPSPEYQSYVDESQVHAWLRWLLGDDFFTHPTMTVVTSTVGMEHLGGLPQLESLILIDDQISDTDLRYLKCLPRLEALYIFGNSITDDGLNHVEELTQLRDVYISSTKVSDSGVKELQQALPNCEIHHEK